MLDSSDFTKTEMVLDNRYIYEFLKYNRYCGYIEEFPKTKF